MLDSFLQGDPTAFTLEAAAPTILSIATFLSLFATALAERAYRLQSLAVLAGLSNTMLLATIFLLATIGHAWLGLAWMKNFFGGEFFFYLFCLSFSGLWFVTAISPSRLAEPPQSRRIFRRWQLAFWGIIALIVFFGAGEGYNLFHFRLHEAVRQILAGIAAGIFVIAAGIVLYRLWHEAAALWFWLALASLAFAAGVSIYYFAPGMPLLAFAAFGVAAFLVITALFADHLRFLRLESELRKGLLENTLKLEDANLRQTAIVEFTREAVLHFDRDERVIYVNPQFLQLIKTVGPATMPVGSNGAQTTPADNKEQSGALEAAQVLGQKFSNLLPREFYEKLLPSAQEARRGRSSLVEIRYFRGGEEIFLQIFAAPLQDKYEKNSGVHLGLLDLTKRHLAARSLEDIVAEKTSELRIFQQCAESAMDAIVITDTDNKILYVNEAFERITGFARSEILGRTPQVYRDETDSGRWGEINRRLIQHKSWRGEITGRRKDGGEFISDLSVIPVADAGEKIIRYLWIERDATARKDLEEKSRRQEEELEARTAEVARVKQNQASLQGRTGELQRRIDQLAKLMEIGEDIRLNVGLDLIMHKVSEAVAALGWQGVLIFQRRGGNEIFHLVAQSGFANRATALLRPLQQMPYAELAPYLLERFRLSESIFIDSRQLAAGRPAFIPAALEITPGGDWLANDALLVPIRSRDQLIGLITVFNPSDGYRPNLQQVRDLEILADDAAIAIENSRLLSLHQSNERQARVLADIGKAFRVAGTVEQVVTEISGIGAQAFSWPCLVLVQPYGEHRWLGALGLINSRSERPRCRLLDSHELSESLLTRFTAAATADSVQIEMNHADLPTTILGEITKPKSALALHESQKPAEKIQLVSLRSRGRSIGMMAYLLPLGAASTAFQHPNDIDFATDIADRAALIIENARLFHETDEKAMALERANQLISEFLASVSHELRTPMHSILQFSEILLSEAPGKMNPEQKRQLTVVQRSGKNLLGLLNDILDLSKIEAGKMEAVIEEFAPAQIIHEAADSIRPLCEQKKLTLRLKLGENLPASFRCDRSILMRVLTNLLGNAVKFTEKGEIEIWARMRTNAFVISVRDTGIGILPARQKEIFEPFRQLENSETRRHGGTGLGLAISKRMLTIINGEIDVESEPGKGAKFTIHLPPSTAPARPVAPGSRPEKTRAGNEPKSKGEEGKSLSKKRAKLPLNFPLVPRNKSSRILVIEDDENTRYAMQFILENAGYQVEFAEAGEKALLAAQHQRPDLILMDIMMPNMDGYQVARMLKAQKQLAHIPVVALTARAMKGDREKALAAGCNDYLTKPFESKDILGMLEKWLGNGT